MPTGQSDQALTRSPACLRPPSVLRGFGVSNGRRCAVITVTVSHNDTACTVEVDGTYSPDLLDDACRRAAACLVATMVQLLAAIDED